MMLLKGNVPFMGVFRRPIRVSVQLVVSPCGGGKTALKSSIKKSCCEFVETRLASAQTVAVQQLLQVHVARAAILTQQPGACGCNVRVLVDGGGAATLRGLVPRVRCRRHRKSSKRWWPSPLLLHRSSEVL